MSNLAASEVAVEATERAIQTIGGWATSPITRWRNGIEMPSYRKF